MSDDFEASCDVYPWKSMAACKMYRPDPAKIIADAEANYLKVMADMGKTVQSYIANNQDRFWGSLLNMDQQVKSGDMTLATGSVDNKGLPLFTQCSKDVEKTITLTHAFESVKFIPIPNSPFKLFKHKGIYNENDTITPYRLRGSLIQDISTTGFTDWHNANLQGGEVISSGQFDEQGKATVTIPACEAGYYYVLAVSPDIPDSLRSSLVTAYQGFVDKCITWLTTQWTTSLQAEWAKFAKNDGKIDSVEVMSHVITGIFGQLKTLYDTLKKVWSWVSECNLTELGKYFSAKGLEQFKAKFEAGGKEIADTLTLLSDEIMLYILVNTLYCYISLLTPQQITNALGEAFGQVLVMSALYLALPGGLATQLLDVLDTASDVIT